MAQDDNPFTKEEFQSFARGFGGRASEFDHDIVDMNQADDYFTQKIAPFLAQDRELAKIWSETRAANLRFRILRLSLAQYFKRRLGL